MFKIGDSVKVTKLLSDEGIYVSMPEHAIGNTYKVADIDVNDNKYKYGLNGVEKDIVYFKEEELELAQE